jgi:hypothetical protein
MGIRFMDSKRNEKYRLKKLVVVGKRIYHKNRLLLHFIFWPVEKIYWLVSVLRLDLWIIMGEEILSKQKFAIIYAGSEENRHFMNKLAFECTYSEKYFGKTWLWEIPKKVKAKIHDCSLIVTEVPKAFRILFKKKNYLFIPGWIEGEVDISDENFTHINKNSSVKSDIRRIRKNKLNFEITNELQQFQNFYYHMYVPHISKTHGNTAFIIDYDSLKNKFKNGDLLLIKNEKEFIAGMMLIYPKNKAHLLYLGIKDGNLNYVRDGAIGALFYFSIVYLREKDYKNVSFDLSRAFLKDGVLQYKKKWGMQIVSTVKMGFRIKILSKTGGAKRFFLNNPLIYMDKKNYNGAIFVENDKSLSQEDIKMIYKDYYIKGISKLFIYRFGKVDNQMQETVPAEFSDKITICSAESLF